jgi:tetratricopeptide (TPR) repeat protein
MKTSERHRLKDNELVMMMSSVQEWYAANRQTLVTSIAVVVVVGGGAGGYLAWKANVEAKARTMLAEAMVVAEAPVQPPGPPAGTTNDPTVIPGQAPGTYPTQQAKLEAALPKLMAAADAYPTSPSGQLARYHAANTLAALGRYDEAIKQYDQLVGSGPTLPARMAHMGKAEAQLRAKQYEAAIATLKQLSGLADSPVPPDAVLMELARAYKMAGRTEDARKTLTEVVEKHADSPLAPEARAELERTKS